MSFSTRWILIGVSRDIEFDIRNDLLDRLLLLEPEFYVRNRTGELMSRATNDLNAVRMVLGPGIMYSATTLVTMLMAIFLMFKLSPSLTMWVLLPVPIVAVVVRHFGKVIHELYEKIQASLAALSVKVQENFSGVRVIRAYAQEDAQIRAFDEPNREYVARNVRADSHLEHVHAVAAGADRNHLSDRALEGRVFISAQPALAGRAGFVFKFFDPPGVADDRAGVGNQYFSARRGVHGAADVHLECTAEH